LSSCRDESEAKTVVSGASGCQLTSECA
jgi:hypothetical protein